MLDFVGVHVKNNSLGHIQWSEAQERAYYILKEYLLQEPVLKIPDLSKLFVLQTDASGVGVAAVLLQENDRKLYPVGYASKKLNLTEARYPIIEKEWLAVVWLSRGSNFTWLEEDLRSRWTISP